MEDESDYPETADDDLAERVEAIEEQLSGSKSEGSIGGLVYAFGSMLAMILSFSLNHSILWAIGHGICSWFYVAYRVYEGNY